MDCLVVYKNYLWWSHIGHIMSCDKSCMMSHWSFVEDNAGQLWVEDIYGYASQSYGGSKNQEEGE
jgi:hypothetical protein